MHAIEGTLAYSTARFEVRAVGTSFYVHWTRRGEQLANGWFNSLAEAISWGQRHAS